MAQIRTLTDKDGNEFYPLTHQAAVYFEDGESLEEKLSKTPKETKSISFYIDGILEAGSNVMSVINPYNLKITNVYISTDTPPTGANIILDINKNGESIYTTQSNRPSILVNTTTPTTALPDVTNINVGDKISLDIDQTGSTVAGENLSVTIKCEVI